MNVVVATDSFKGSLTSLEAGQAIRRGILRAIPEAQVLVIPVADGGEGTTQAMIQALGGTLVSVPVTGPYGDPVTAQYGWIPEQRRAVLEAAAASGLTLSPRREPLEASSVGVGEMIRHAIGLGCRSFLVGLGGSATNDGGIGMLSALGFRFLDRQGRPCGTNGAALAGIASVDRSQVLPELGECQFALACDVTNPLCGERGCTWVYGPQKGVTEDLRVPLDAAMSHYADVTAQALGADCRMHPGAGAAGGLGFAFLAYLHGTLRRGIDLVLDALDLEHALEGADLVVTGEGCLDRQTAFGKTPAGVAQRAKRHQIPVVAFAGSIRPGAEVCSGQGIDAWFAALPRVMTLEEAMAPETAARNLEETAEQVFRLAAVLGGREEQHPWSTG